MNNKILYIFIFFIIISILLHTSADSRNISILLTILIIIIISINPSFYGSQTVLSDFGFESVKESVNIKEKILESLPKTTNNYRIEENKYFLKYLEKDIELCNIANILQFTKRYDISRYAELLNIMNTFKKTYIYIMGDRWDLNHFLPLLIDLKKDILEIMYSMYIIIPKKSKNFFGIELYKELEKSIDLFTIYVNKKLEIIKKYGKKQKKIIVIDTKIMPYNYSGNNILP
jgi:hypothetical protein